MTQEGVPGNTSPNPMKIWMGNLSGGEGRKVKMS